MSSSQPTEREAHDPLAELRAELKPILAGIDWSDWMAERDRINRERALSRIRSKMTEDQRTEKILAVMSVLTVT